MIKSYFMETHAAKNKPRYMGKLLNYQTWLLQCHKTLSKILESTVSGGKTTESWKANKLFERNPDHLLTEKKLNSDVVPNHAAIAIITGLRPGLCEQFLCFIFLVAIFNCSCRRRKLISQFLRDKVTYPRRAGVLVFMWQIKVAEFVYYLLLLV